jgi:ketosteroid isomerase-like protein
MSPDTNDYEEIRRVLAKYCRAIDDRDFAALEAIWTPDAKLLIGRQEFEGREAIVAVIREAASQSAPGAHAGYNVEISLAGSGADVTSDYLAFRSDRQLETAGRYTDEFVKSDGAWLLSQRRIAVRLRP